MIKMVSTVLAVLPSVSVVLALCMRPAKDVSGV